MLAIFSAVTGKYLSEIGLFILGLNENWTLKIKWWVAFISAFIGAYTHVVLDSIMHADVEAFYPFSTAKPLLEIISVSALHQVCLYSGLVGGIVYFIINRAQQFKK